MIKIHVITSNYECCVLNRLGVTGDEEKWRTCISDTDSTIGFALGAMFVKEAFRGESKNTVSN